MQNTLLAIAIALIAALVAALVGPWLVDWNAHKPRIEAEASRLFGTPVRIGGDLTIRLLPTIRIDARDVTVGTERGGARIGRIRGELRVAPLLRGEASLNTLHVRDADITLSLATLPGRIVLVDDLTVENARLSVVDATGPTMLVAERMMLSGESRGIQGPVRLEGSAKVGESSLPLHLLMSLTESGALALRLRVAERPDGPGIEAEGTIGASGRPRFDGDIVLTGRAGRLPWRVAGPAALTAQALVVQRAEAQAGAGDRLVRATGSFRYMFGPAGGLEAILNARQIDLDRLVEGPTRLPRDVLNTLLADVPHLASGGFPIALGFEIGGMVLGGAQLTDLRGDVQSGAGRWVVQRLSARLPGDSAVEAAGDLALAGEQGFSGSLTLNAARPAVLMAWLDGLQAPTGTLDDPIQLTTRMTADAGRLLLDDIQARTAAGQATGRLALDVPALGRHALQAQLDADSLDLDLLTRIARGAGARLDPATDTRIQLRARQASLAGLVARDVDLAIATDGRTFDAERLRVGDLAGFGLDLTGRLDGFGGPLIGRLSGRLRAANVDGLVALLNRSESTRTLAGWLRDRSAALAGADLGLTFAASGRSALGLRIEGRVDEADLQIDAAGAGDPFHPSGLTGRVTVSVDAARADQIFALVAGTEAPAPTPVARTRLTVLLERPDLASWRLSGSAQSTVSTLTFDGERRQDQTQLSASLRSSDIAALMPLLGVPAELAGPLPATFDLRASARGADWKTERAEGRLGATAVTAVLNGRGAAARGEVTLGALSGEAAMAFLSGPAWLVETGAGEFASAALGGTVFDRIDMDIGFGIARVGLGGYPALEDLSGRLVRQGQGVALRNLRARMGASTLS
ncbi:MAG: AsmA family protein, partial [Phreatobacter sp.]|nr:AsmA family protein [Phreatobacter sp.]